MITFDEDDSIDVERSGGEGGDKDRSDHYAITVSEFNGRKGKAGQSQLLLLQNVKPAWIKILHDPKRWDVPLDFFLAHVSNSDWYTLQNIPEQLSMLHSLDPAYIRIQYVVTREWEDLREVPDGKSALGKDNTVFQC